VKPKLGLLAQLVCAAAALFAGAGTPARAWPNQPLRIVVPHVPGGSSDTVAQGGVKID
jgi:tripartite-type tricarboxylate transporter receptor subunit TctC